MRERFWKTVPSGNVLYTTTSSIAHFLENNKKGRRKRGSAALATR